MNGTGSKFWIGMVLGIIGMVIMLILVPIIRDLAVGVTVKNALDILEREGYVAYSNPEGELITKGVLPETANTYELGNVNYEWKNLYLGDAGGILLGTAQDVYLHRHAADQLGVHSDLNLEGNALLGGTRVKIGETTIWATTGAWQIEPSTGDLIGALVLRPSGTVDRSFIQIRNASDESNFGNIIIDIDGSIAKIIGGREGTGTAPTELQISGMTLKVDNIHELTAGANVTFGTDIDLGGNALLGGTNVQLVERVVPGWGNFYIKPTATGQHVAFEIVPTGTGKQVLLNLRNAEDFANSGRVSLQIYGDTAKIVSGKDGTGTAPNKLQIEGMDLKIGDRSIKDILTLEGRTGGDWWIDATHDGVTGRSTIFRTYNAALTSKLDRLTITGGADIATVKIMNADLNIGANKLKTTNLALKEYNADYLQVRNAADTANKGLVVKWLSFTGAIEAWNSPVWFQTQNADGAYLIAKARKTGVGMEEIFRMVGATEPFMQLTSLGYGVKTVTAAYTAAYDAVIRCDASAGAFTVSLPTASGIKGKAYLIKKVDSSANAVTIDPYGTETIDGAATITLASQYDSVIVVSDGTNWMKF